ncbi:uncharacterized protein WM277_005696 [Molossus nigricans]
MKILAVKTVPSQMPLFWRMKFISGHSGGGKSKIKVLVSITISMPIHAVPKGTAAKSTAPGHDEHQILHTGRGLLIQAYFCRSSKDSLQRKLTPATRQSSSRRLGDFHP